MYKAPRPTALSGETAEIITGCGPVYITVNNSADKPFEVFLNMGKAGGCAYAQTEAIGRLISYALRIGGDAEELIKELQGIHCHQAIDDGATSCADAVARVLKTKQTEKVEA